MVQKKIKFNNQLASFYIIISSFCFALMTALIKNLKNFPIEQIIFFRCFIALIFGLIFLAFIKKFKELNTKNLKLHFLRGITGLSAMFCYFMAYRELELAKAHALSEVKTIFITIFAIIFLKERVTKERLTAVIFGLLGVIVMLNPSAPEIDPGTLYALSGAFLAAIALTLVSALTKKEHPLIIVNYFMIFGTLFSFYFAFNVWQNPSYLNLLQLISIGFSGVLGQIFLVFAFKTGDASYIAPFTYLGLLWGSLFGFIFWSEIPTIYLLFGSIMIVGSQLYLHKKETKKTKAIEVI